MNKFAQQVDVVFPRKSKLFHVTQRNCQFIYTLYLACWKHKFKGGEDGCEGRLGVSIYKWNCWFTWSWKFYYFSRKILGKMREFESHMTMATIYYPSKTMANFANMLLNRLKLCYTFKVWTWRKIPLAKLFLCSFCLYLWIINNSLA